VRSRAQVDLIDLIASSKADLAARFPRLYFAGGEVELLRRNALVSLANKASRISYRQRRRAIRAITKSGAVDRWPTYSKAALSRLAEAGK